MLRAIYMIRNLHEANKNIAESKEFYRRYIRQVQEQMGNLALSRLLDVSGKYIYKIVDDGSVMALYRMAKKIDDAIRGQK